MDSKTLAVILLYWYGIFEHITYVTGDNEQFAMYWKINEKKYCWLPETTSVTSGTRLIYREADDCCTIMQYHAHELYPTSMVASINEGELCLSIDKNENELDGRHITLDTDCGSYPFNGDDKNIGTKDQKKLVFSDHKTYCMSMDGQGYNILVKCADMAKDIIYDGGQCYTFFLNSIYSVWYNPQPSTAFHVNQSHEDTSFTIQDIVTSTKLETSMIPFYISSTQTPLKSTYSDYAIDSTRQSINTIKTTQLHETSAIIYVPLKTTTVYEKETSTMIVEHRSSSQRLVSSNTNHLLISSTKTVPVSTKISNKVSISTIIDQRPVSTTKIRSNFTDFTACFHSLSSRFLQTTNLPLTSSKNNFQSISSSMVEAIKDTSSMHTLTSLYSSNHFFTSHSMSKSYLPKSSSTATSTSSYKIMTTRISCISSFSSTSASYSTLINGQHQTTNTVRSSVPSSFITSLSINSLRSTSTIALYQLITTTILRNQSANFEEPEVISFDNCRKPCNNRGGRCDWCGPSGYCCQRDEKECEAYLRFGWLDYHVCVLKDGIRVEAKSEIINFDDCLIPCGNRGGRCTWCGPNGYCCKKTGFECDSYLRSKADVYHVCVYDGRDKSQVISPINCLPHCGYKGGRCPWCGPNRYCCRRNGTDCDYHLRSLALDDYVCVRGETAKPTIISSVNCYKHCGEKGGRCSWCGPNGFCCNENEEACPENLRSVALDYHVCVRAETGIVKGKPDVISTEDCLARCGNKTGRCDWCGSDGYCCRNNGTGCDPELSSMALDYHVCVRSKSAKAYIVSSEDCFNYCGNMSGRCDWCGPNGYCCRKGGSGCASELDSVALDYHVCLRVRAEIARPYIISTENCYGHCGKSGGRCSWCGPNGFCCRKNATECDINQRSVALDYYVCIHDDGGSVKAVPYLISTENCFIHCERKGGRCKWCGPSGYCCQRNGTACEKNLRSVALDHYVCVRGKSGKPQIISSEDCFNPCRNQGGRCVWCGPNGYCCQKGGTDCANELSSVAYEYHVCVRSETAKPYILSSESCLKHCHDIEGRCNWCGPNGFCCRKNSSECSYGQRLAALDYHVCIFDNGGKAEAPPYLISSENCTDHCGDKAGRCNWCGPNGFCCRKNGKACSSDLQSLALDYNVCIRAKTVKARIVSYDNCFIPCGQKGGRCAWCGPNGYCCRRNGTDCANYLRSVALDYHVCIAADEAGIDTGNSFLVSSENCYRHCGNTSGICSWCGPNGYCCSRNGTECPSALRSVALDYHVCVRGRTAKLSILSTEYCLEHCRNKAGKCYWCGPSGFCCSKTENNCTSEQRSVALHYHVCVGAARGPSGIISTENCYNYCGQGGRCIWCGPNGYCCEKNGAACTSQLRSIALEYPVCVRGETDQPQISSSENCYSHCGYKDGKCYWCGYDGYCCSKNSTNCDIELRAVALDYHVCIRAGSDKSAKATAHLVGAKPCLNHCGKKGGRCDWCGLDGYCCRNNGTDCSVELRSVALDYYVCVRLGSVKPYIISTENCFNLCGNMSGRCDWCGPNGFCCEKYGTGCDIHLSSVALDYHVCVGTGGGGVTGQPQIISTENCWSPCGNNGGICKWCGPNGYCCKKHGIYCTSRLRSVALDYPVCVRDVSEKPQIISSENCFSHCGNKSGRCDWCGANGYCCRKNGTGCAQNLRAVALDNHVCIRAETSSQKAKASIISSENCLSHCNGEGGRCVWCGPEGYCCRKGGTECSNDLSSVALDYHVCVRADVGSVKARPHLISTANCLEHCSYKAGRCIWCGPEGYCCRKNGTDCALDLMSVALDYHVCVRAETAKAQIVSSENCLKHCGEKGGRCDWCGPNGFCCRKGGAECTKELSSVALDYHVCIRAENKQEKEGPSIVSSENCLSHCGNKGGICDWCGPNGYCCRKGGSSCDPQMRSVALDYHVCIRAEVESDTEKPYLISTEECWDPCGKKGGRCNWCGDNGYCCRKDGVDCASDLNEVALDYHVCVRAATAYLGSWARWSPCGVTCGYGVQVRHSQCEIDVQKDQLECGEEYSETRNCSTPACPVNGGFSEWTQWSNCSKPCGIGYIRRYRLCDNPKPQGTGKGCMGIKEEGKVCNVEFCKIVGEWSSWGRYSECNKPCNSGTIERRRTCVVGENRNYDRRVCPGGIYLETKICNTHKCKGKRVLIELDVLTDGILNRTDHIQLSDEEKQILTRHVIDNVEEFYSSQEGNVTAVAINDMRPIDNRTVHTTVEVWFNGLDGTQLLDLQNGISKVNRITNLDLAGEYQIHVTNSSINQSYISPKLYGIKNDEVLVSWDRHEDANENMTYVIWYKKTGDSASEYKAIGSRCCNISLLDLMPGKSYMLSVVPYVGDDVGVPTKAIKFFTKLGKPAFPPRDIEVKFDELDLYVYWDVYEEDLLNIVGFQVTAQSVELGVSRVIKTDLSHTVFYGLNSSTGYFVLICAYSAMGCGPVARTHAKSPDAAPSVPPLNITVNSVMGLTELRVSWIHIPSEYVNGILTHYEIMYEEFYDDESKERLRRVEQIHSNFSSTLLTNLKISQKYRIVMWGVNQYMKGVKSVDIIGETSACPNRIYTNYMVLPPYVCAPDVETNTFDETRCLFMSILTDAFRDMCGENMVTIDLLNNGIGNWARKKHLLLMKQDIPLGVGISYPYIAVSERFEVNGGVFVPVLPHPGIIIITNKESVDTVVSNTFHTLLKCWPVVLCITLLGVLAGVIFWLLEDNTHREGKLRHPIAGISTGIWWAFIASTTLGYGDKIPLTFYGRLFATIWIIIGIVLTSICTAVLTSSLNAIYAKDDLRIYGKKVGAMPGSYAIKVAIRRNAIIDPEANLTSIEELVVALRKRKVSHILVDIYAAMDTLLFMSANPDLIYSDVIKDTESYGFVVSNHLGTIGEKVHSFILSKQSEITNFLARYANKTLKHEKVSGMSVSLFHSKTPSFTTAVKILGIMLGCALCLGLLHMYCDKVRRGNKINPHYKHRRRYDDLLKLMEETKLKAGKKLQKIKELETPPTYSQIVKYNAMDQDNIRNHFKENTQEEHAIHIPEEYFFLPTIDTFRATQVVHDRNFVPEWFLRRKNDNPFKSQYHM